MYKVSQTMFKQLRDFLSRAVDLYYNILLKYPRTILVLVLIGSIPALYYVTKPTFKSSLDIYFLEDDPTWIAYKEFRKIFGNDEYILVTLTADEIYEKQNIGLIRQMTEELKTLPHVQDVFSLSEVHIPETGPEGLDFKQIIGENHSDKDVEQLQKIVAVNEHYQKRLLSTDNKTTAILVEIDAIFEHTAKVQVIASVVDKVRSLAQHRFKVNYTGGPVIETEITKMLIQDNSMFLPLSAVVVVVVTLLSVRNISLSIIVLSNVLLSTIWGIGILFMNGHSINVFTVIVGPLIIAISIADAIHIVAHFQHDMKDPNREFFESLKGSFRTMWSPCFFTTATTTLGYFSLSFTTVKMVKILGFYMALGVLLALFFTYVFLPAAMLAFKPIIGRGAMFGKARTDGDGNRRRDPIVNILNGLSWISVNHYRTVTVFFVAIMIFLSWGASKIIYKTDFYKYIRKDHPVAVSANYALEKIPSAATLEIAITAHNPKDYFSNPDSLRLIEEIDTIIRQELKESIITSMSVVTYVKEMHKAFNNEKPEFYRIPDNAMTVADYYELANDRLLKRFLSLNHDRTRISLSVPPGAAEAPEKVVEILKRKLSGEYAKRFSFTTPGVVSTYHQLDKNLKTSQLSSLSVAIALVFICMFFVAQNFPKTFTIMLPNFFPVLATFALMGFAGIWLEASSIMIASITMGLVVDNTIHITTKYRRMRMAGHSAHEAIHETIVGIGRPIIATTLIIIAGFSVAMVGSVTPVITFGSLSSFSLGVSLIGALVFLPSLLLLYEELTERFRAR
jgi:predicted RND superfamily exporter protein